VLCFGFNLNSVSEVETDLDNLFGNKTIFVLLKSEKYKYFK
jgi:hypothetical protein